MANHVSHASLPYPIKNARFTIGVPYLDADGDPTDPTTPDTEVSQDGGTYADATEETTTISGSNGSGYVTLTGAETNNSLVMVCAKVASGPKATLATLYPRNLPILASGTASAGTTTSLTLTNSITYDITGCFLRTTGGTGGGGTGGANNQARRISAYNTSTQVATITPNWETTPDNTTTYDILCPDGITPQILKALNPTTAGRTLDVSSGGEAGLDWANIGSPTTAVNLSGTTTGTTTLVNTVTTLTNLPAITTDWLTATGLATSAVQEIRDAITGYSGSLNVDSGGNVKVSDGTGANQIDTTSGAIAHVVLVDTATTVTNQLTAAQVATGVWNSTAASDFSVTHSIGKSLYLDAAPGASGGHLMLGNNAGASGMTMPAMTYASTVSHASTVSYGNLTVAGTLSVATLGVGTAEFTGQVHFDSGVTFSDYLSILGELHVGTSVTMPSDWLTGDMLAADAITKMAAGTWQDTSASHFSVTSSIGKSLYTGAAPGAAGGLLYCGNNAAATVPNVTTVNTLTNLPAITTDWLTATGLATSAVQEIRDAITGYSGSLNVDSGGNVKVSDGTGANQIDTTSGAIAHVVLVDTTTTVTNQVTTAQILAQIETALSTTTRSLPGQVAPSATPALTDVMMQLYQQATNPTRQTSSQQSIMNRAGSVVHQKRTVSDDLTTFALGAVAAGP